MGLDMYLYRATKPDLSAHRIYSYMDLRKQGYACIDAEENGSIPSPVADLRPFTKRMRLRAEYYDLEKIQQHFNMSEKPVVSTITQDNVSFYCYETNQHGSIPQNEIQQFVTEKVSVFYVVKLQELGYWRNQHELSEKICTAIARHRHLKVQNCGYYRMTKAIMQMISRYNKKHGLSDINYDPEEIRSIFYHEWY